ncbi:MAG: hypothetical protein MK098_14955 [Marinovum sp.]|nr:hypothetical protein [Marinovum sp.]
MVEFLTVWLILILDPIAALIMIVATMSNRALQVAPVWHRLGMLVTACGLLGQSARNLVYVITGHSPSDLEMPFWVLKDYGLVILTLHFAYLIWVGKRDGG